VAGDRLPGERDEGEAFVAPGPSALVSIAVALCATIGSSFYCHDAIALHVAAPPPR
jgi:hypothetical protein